MLLEKAQPADITQQYPSCLVAACSGAQIGIAGALHGAGANANLADENNHTPLCAAAQTGCVDLIALLLDAKADMNALSAKGQTALMAAAAASRLVPVAFQTTYLALDRCHPTLLAWLLWYLHLAYAFMSTKRHLLKKLWADMSAMTSPPIAYATS